MPFLIAGYRAAIVLAIVVLAFELVVLAVIRWRLFHTRFVRSFASVTLGGEIIATVSTVLGVAAG